MNEQVLATTIRVEVLDPCICGAFYFFLMFLAVVLACFSLKTYGGKKVKVATLILTFMGLYFSICLGAAFVTHVLIEGNPIAEEIKFYGRRLGLINLFSFFFLAMNSIFCKRSRNE